MRNIRFTMNVARGKENELPEDFPLQVRELLLGAFPELFEKGVIDLEQQVDLQPRTLYQR